jgi:TM2 domain-containing membrane protein YozV
MKCVNHPRAEASATCATCGRSFCGDCLVELRGRPWCVSCLEGLAARAEAPAAPAGAGPHRSNRLVAAALSIIPGAGHMYLGLIGKGFALMGLLIASAFVVIVYSASTGMYWITAYLVPCIGVLLLSYAVFDSLAVADAKHAGRQREPDPTMDLIAERVLFNSRTAGWAVLVAGIVGVLDVFEKTLGALLRSLLGLDVPVTALVVPVVLLAIGVRLLVRGRGGRRG